MSTPASKKTSGQFISIQKLHVAKMTADLPTPEYDTPVDLGLVLRQVDIKPTNNSVTAYADGQSIDTANTTAYYDLTFETAALPLEYYAYLLGHSYENGQMTVHKDDVAPFFAVMFQSDKRNGKIQFSEPDETGKTKEENIEFQFPTITAKAIYRLYDGNVYTKADEEDDSTTFSTWYTEVDPVSS